MRRTLFLLLAAAASASCGSTDDGKGSGKEESGGQEPSGAPAMTGAQEPPAPAPEYAPGVTVEETQAVFETAPYDIEPGQERFLCYATTIDQDLTVEAIGHEARSTLHHVIFSKTSVPEPDGYSECDTLFRLTWEPLYLAGAGKSELALPAGYAHRVPAGTQVVAQLHLLNSTDETVHDSVRITMRRATAEAPKPVAVYAFGNVSVNLPASQASSLVGTCNVKEPVRLLAGFPHMHMLGTALTFDVSRAGGSFERAFTRDPYDFDDQHLDAMDLTLNAGDQARVTCSYDNKYDHPVTFGESTLDEMCFFVAIAADREKIGGCMGGGPAATGATTTGN